MAVLLGCFVLTVATLSLWRGIDHRADRAAMQELTAGQPPQPRSFDAGLVAALPEPARRYFLYTIAREPRCLRSPESTWRAVSVWAPKTNPIIWILRRFSYWPCRPGSSGKCRRGVA